ncbi:hypothetical protein L6452_27428 [Arctium lappa]|uniref:Uncharacterized protein n=1 Tax=Arctium lappa TaxID=4217 RepID=A0ACB8ZX65_ARCLA|nr:hypothetical protein L6452_27428 [Arctium lappa]
MEMLSPSLSSPCAYLSLQLICVLWDSVGKQEGSFRKAFEGYQKTGEHSKEKIDQWRKALKEVSTIAGKVLPDESNEVVITRRYDRGPTGEGVGQWLAAVRGTPTCPSNRDISIKEKQKADDNQQNAVRRKRILLLLDDVDEIEQVNVLLNAGNSALEQLEASLDERNRKTLEVGYKLLDGDDRRLFLAIASLFVGKEKGEAVKMLEEGDFYSEVGMQNLMDRSLIRVGEDNKLIMQRSLLDMARAIIRQETVDESGEHNPARAKTETVASEGKRKRARDYEHESMPQNTASSSFKRLCLGFFSLFKPTKLLYRENIGKN